MKFAWFYVLAILVTLPLWLRLIRRDRQLLLLYLGGLLGAMIGAKICYVSVEGLADLAQPDRVMRLLAGKSILGALIGGFVAVELIKKLHGIERITGDFFAIIVPIGIAIGRVGCVVNGCCGGVNGWPAPLVEMGFNLLLATIVFIARGRFLRGQWFHVYLIAYGFFRFAHEFLRATPKCCLGISGYQVWSLLLAVIGIVAFANRRAEFQRLEETGGVKFQ
jgi:phosphatidylglycerol:prolipoprotein diacylglycerol transferase